MGVIRLAWVTLPVGAAIALYFVVQQRRPEPSRDNDPDSRSGGPARGPLEILYDGPSVEIDIVAVHGLGSSVDWAWTWKDGDKHVHWPRDLDMLPHQVPNARIMTYNYLSGWHSDAPKTRLRLLGENLARSLHESQHRKTDPHRPIVFIGHSLGGLVITHALLYAERNESMQHLTQATVGLIALGSPFRGTRMQSLADLAARIMIIAGSRTSIIKDLALDNDMLWEKLQDFCQLQAKLNLPVFCFFELLRTDYGKRFGIPGLFKGMVVDEKSASVESWHSRSLNTDHLKINKFSGPHDPSFLSVSQQVIAMCANSQNLIRERRNAGRRGLGGLGKTSIAVELTFRLLRDHPQCSIFWVPAVDLSTFEIAYREIGRMLEIPNIDQETADVKNLVRAALNQHSEPWLLIIDNADDQALLFDDPALQKYIPSSCNGSVLFTTRTHEVPSRLGIATANTIRLTELSRDEATELLRNNLGNNQCDDQSMHELLELLTDMPLAVKQAAAYISQTDITTKRYLEHCLSSDRTMIKLLSKGFQDKNRYEDKDRIRNPIIMTWLMSFQSIARDHPRAAQAMKQVSLLGEKDIPRACFTPDVDEIDDLDMEEIIGTLKAYAFIQQRVDQKSYDIHRLVRLAMQNWLHQEKQFSSTVSSATQVMATIFPWPDHSNRHVWAGLLPHGMELAKNVSIHTEQDAQLIKKLRTGNRVLGKCDEAARLSSEILQYVLQAYGEDHPETSAYINDFGLHLSRQGNYRQAENMHECALELQIKVLGPEHPGTLASRDNLASARQHLGRLKEAEAMYRENVVMRIKVLGAADPSVFISMSNLASVLDEQGKYSEAEELHRNALSFTMGTLGVDHASSLACMNNLGTNLEHQGKYEEAQSVHIVLLDLRVQGFGAEHVDTMITMNNIGLLLYLQHLDGPAAAVFRNTLELQTQVLGATHHNTIATMINLSLVLTRQGETTEAETLLRTILSSQISAGGGNPVDVVNAANCLGAALFGQGRYEEAEAVYCELFSAAVGQVLGDEHPSMLSCNHNFAVLLIRRQKYDEGERVHRKVLRVRLALFGSEHQETLYSLQELRELLVFQDRHAEIELLTKTDPPSAEP